MRRRIQQLLSGKCGSLHTAPFMERQWKCLHEREQYKNRKSLYCIERINTKCWLIIHFIKQFSRIALALWYFLNWRIFSRLCLLAPYLVNFTSGSGVWWLVGNHIFYSQMMVLGKLSILYREYLGIFLTYRIHFIFN